MKKWYRILFIIPVLLGLFLLKSSRSQVKEPAKKENVEISLKVSVAKVEVRSLPTTMRAYGTAVADRIWRAVPEVSGRVTGVHPRLKTGERVLQGEVLFSVDGRDYRLEQRRVGYERRALSAELAQLDARERELRQSLRLARANVSLSRKDQQRYRDLYEAGAVPASQTETKTRDLLSQRRQVQELETSLSTIPQQRQAIRARMAATRVQQQSQGLRLERSQVVAPFTGRLQQVYLEAGQVVNAGQELFTLQASESLRIEAKLPAREFALFTPLKATVHYSGTTQRAEILPLRESVDPTARTVALQLRLDRPGKLLPGSLVEVELEGPPRPPVAMIPRTALHGDSVYLVEDGKLAIRKVESGFRDGEYLAVTDGLKGGETLVVSDPGLGMAGTPVEIEGLP